MWQRFFSKDFQRRHALSRAAPGVLYDYLATPLPGKKMPCTEAEIVSLDLETTGLDPKKDSILSYGLVHLGDMNIRLESSQHQYISIKQEIPEESAVIHRITDDKAAGGSPLEEVLPELLATLAGKVMLAHYARLEQNFLDAACRELYGAPFVIRTIDTLVLAQRRMEMRNHTIQTGDLRLFNLRPRYNLPQYKAHNALSDAVATAELFLAMAAEMFPAPEECRLERFLTD
jgi:DNA polymerase-3 subunit epsilon